MSQHQALMSQHPAEMSQQPAEMSQPCADMSQHGSSDEPAPGSYESAMWDG